MAAITTLVAAVLSGALILAEAVEQPAPLPEPEPAKATETARQAPAPPPSPDARPPRQRRPVVRPTAGRVRVIVDSR